MPDTQRQQLMLAEYSALRAEIIQSISYQHQILLAGYGAAGGFAGYILTKPDESLPALIAVPYILLGMSLLWTVECNRMVRASYYIGEVLWRALRASVEPSTEPQWLIAEWEHWIRGSRGMASTFRHRQHRSQSVVVLWAPLILTLVLAAVTITSRWTHDRTVSYYLIAASMLAVLLWIRVGRDLPGISDLGASPTTVPPNTP